MTYQVNSLEEEIVLKVSRSNAQYSLDFKSHLQSAQLLEGSDRPKRDTQKCAEFI